MIYVMGGPLKSATCDFDDPCAFLPDGCAYDPSVLKNCYMPPVPSPLGCRLSELCGLPPAGGLSGICYY